MTTVTAKMALMSQVSFFSIHSFICRQFIEHLLNARLCVLTKADPFLPSRGC